MRAIWITFFPMGKEGLGQYKADHHSDEWQVVEVDRDVEVAQYFVAGIHALVAAGSRCPSHFKRSQSPFVVVYI